MKRALYSLFRKGDANFVKILCLGAGLALGLIMLAEVIFERSYDNFIPRLEDTYRIQESYKQKDSDWRMHASVPGAIAPGMKSYCPEVEVATRYTILSRAMKLVTEDQREITGNAYLCDSSFFDVFPRKLLLGEDTHTGLEKTGNAYISQKLMQVLGEDVLGKKLSWKEYPSFQVTVVGVFEDFPENTHLPQMDVLVAMPTIGQIAYDGRDNWFGNDRYSGYVRLHAGAKPERLQAGIQRMLDMHVNEKIKGTGTEFQLQLQPVAAIFAASDYNRTMNIVFLIFAIIVMVVAILNYVLLTISSMVNRAKGIATYRCYGATDAHIYRMILSESVLHGLLALVLAVLIIFGLQDFLQEQIGHSLASLFPLRTLGICLAVTCLVMGLCGFVPGYLYTRIPVTYAYRRYSESKRQWKLGLLFVQFLLTSLFVSLLTVVSLQYQKLTHFDLGFEYQDMVYTSLRGTTAEERERCVQELKKHPDVVDVTWGYQEMYSRCSGNNVYNPATDEEYMNIADMYQVGPDYHRTFSIPVLEGEVFNPALQDTLSQQVMVSRGFVERMRTLAGWEGSAIGKQIHVTEHKGTLTICGVYENISLGSQFAEDYDERPTVMFYSPSPSYILYIRLNKLDAGKLKEMQEIVSQTMPSQTPPVYSLAMEIGNIYNPVLHVRNSVFFAGVCILLIALIGLMAYVRDEVSRRCSEIAVRMIHGARVIDVQRIFLFDLLKVALPAVVAGMLVAWKISLSFLELFAVKIELTGMFFLGCAMLVLMVVLLLASCLVLQAARRNPTENLRQE